nr:MAG TPA: hypothetical protein [Caudoviricetes sp.]DAS32318.1 MAG TPA: hypothetical protein [Caudoviricetes sp.]
MRIFQLDIKSMPIPGGVLRTLGISFLSGYLGFDVTEKQAETLAQGMSYRSWVDDIDLRNALCGGISKIDESTIKPISIDDRRKKRDEILSELNRVIEFKKRMDPNSELSPWQREVALRWIEGVAMGSSLADWTPEEHASSAFKYAKQRETPKTLR